MAALYESPAIQGLVARFAGKQLYAKASNDMHGCTLYYYGRPKDSMAYHYDSCGCRVGGSYTMLIGIVNDSSSRLEAKLYHSDPNRETRKVSVSTTPGCLVLFNGGKLWHGVTPQGPNEQRALVSLSYRANAVRLPLLKRARENLKDGLLFFGLPAVLQQNYFEKTR